MIKINFKGKKRHLHVDSRVVRVVSLSHPGDILSKHIHSLSHDGKAIKKNFNALAAV